MNEILTSFFIFLKVTMSSASKSEVDQMTFRDLAIKQASQITSENPLPYTPLMYKTVNPMAMQLALKDAKQLISKQNKKNGKECEVYLTLGGEYNSEQIFVFNARW